MKYSSMKTIKFLMMLALVLTSLSSKADQLRAEDIWQEGTTLTSVSWFATGNPIRVSHLYMGLPEEINGKTYLTQGVSYSSDGNYATDNKLKFRAENNRVYFYCEDLLDVVDGGEVCIYDFNNLDTDMSMVGQKLFCEIKGDDEESFTVTYSLWEEQNYEFDSKELCPSYFPNSPELWIYSKSNSKNQLVSGLGWLNGLFSMFYGTITCNYLGTSLGEVRNPQGELIYRDPRMDEWEKEAGVKDIDAPIEESPLLYDLFGRQVVNPQSGCVYIQNGKKVIFPNR